MNETATSLGYSPQELQRLAEERADEYQRARPFSHIVLDDFLPEPVLRQLIDEFPGPDDADWKHYDNKRELKLALEDEALIPAPHVRLLRELNAQAFVNFVETLTGIPGLVPDPHLRGAGLHQIPAGGFFKVHVDFNLHPRTGLEKRVNLLLYLNEDWHDSYQGNLELWNSSMAAAEQSIAPVANRLVIFTSSDQSHHGHPAPLMCPPERTRRSMALYYYSAVQASVPDKHSTLFKARPGEKMFSMDEVVKRRIVEAAPKPAKALAKRILHR